MRVTRFTATEKGKQNFTLKYAPNPLGEGNFAADGENGILYTARLDNNQMEYAVRIHVIAKKGTVQYADGAIKVTGADEVMVLLTADTDY